MGVATSKNFTKSLDVRIQNLYIDAAAKFPTLSDRIFKDHPAPAGNEIREAEMSPLGVLRPMNESGMVEYDIPREGNEKARTFSDFGLGFQITLVMKEDQVHDAINQMPTMLGRAAIMKQELSAWDMFNSGFATHVCADGQYIFDASGRVYMKTGEAVSNAGGAVALSESSLQDAFEYFQTVKDDAGYPYPMMGKKLLIVPYQLQWVAQTLYNTAGKPGSMDNDNNTVKDFGGWEYMVVPQFLTSATAWFVLDMSEQDFRVSFKRRPKLMSRDDFDTGNTLYKVTERYVHFCNRWRGGYGATGA